jgi:hypothetical protein
MLRRFCVFWLSLISFGFFVPALASSVFNATMGTVFSSAGGGMPREVDLLLRTYWGGNWRAPELTLGVLASERFLRDQLRLYSVERSSRESRRSAMSYIRAHLQVHYGLAIGLTTVEKDLYELHPDHPLFLSVAELHLPLYVRDVIRSNADPFFSYDLVNMTVLDLVKIYLMGDREGHGFAMLMGPSRAMVRMALADALGNNFVNEFTSESVLSRRVSSRDFPSAVGRLVRDTDVRSVGGFLRMMEDERFLALYSRAPAAVQESLMNLRSQGLGFTIPQSLLSLPGVRHSRRGLSAAAEGFGGLGAVIRPLLDRGRAPLASTTLGAGSSTTSNPTDAEVIEMPHDDFEQFDPLSRRVLRANGLQSMAELMKMSDAEILGLRGMSLPVATEIHRVLGRDKSGKSAQAEEEASEAGKKNDSCRDAFHE